VLSSFGEIMLLVVEIDEGRELAVGLKNHVPAFPPVAAIGSPAGNIFFAAKANATLSSVSGFDEDFCFINKFDRLHSRDAQ
jgi:hypothetical protein